MSENPYEMWGHDTLDAAQDHPDPDKRALIRAEIARRARIRRQLKLRDRAFDLGVMSACFDQQNQSEHKP
jgi:hypothetical protein